ncbi:MAG: DnaJ domain-containing protein [Myxococcota bacterium]|nr:DnaJ domain-containing protein [Myxococcota bacterium]
MQSLEVLYDSHIIDERTPISQDGRTFHRLEQVRPVIAHLRDVKAQLNEGIDVWREPEPAMPTELRPPDRAKTETIPALMTDNEFDFETTSPVKVMFKLAVSKRTGTLAVKLEKGMLYLYYRDGKVVDANAELEARKLASYLVKNKICDQSAVRTGIERAPQMGGDLGTALIALGLIQPHEYVTHYVTWAKSLVGFVVAQTSGSCFFSDEEVKTPAIPLGLDRFKVLIDAVRLGFTETELSKLLSSKKKCLLIPAHADGATIEELKLDSRELRVYRGIDGTTTYGEIVGKAREKAGSVVRCVYLITELGYVVFGEAPTEAEANEPEVQELQDLYEALKSKNYYEILTITSKSTDEEVRNSYMKLAKKYHPDTVSHSSSPKVVETNNNIFALIQDAFDQVDTQEKRSNYDTMLKAGVTTKADEQKLVQSILEAENLFTKAQTYVRTHQVNMAIEALEQAIRLKSDDPEFETHLAYYKFLAQKDDKKAAAARAINAIERQLRKQPNMASAHLFLGRLNKLNDDLKKSMSHLEKVISIDPNNLEAKSDLRLVKMRLQKSKSRKGLF